MPKRRRVRCLRCTIIVGEESAYRKHGGHGGYSNPFHLHEIDSLCFVGMGNRRDKGRSGASVHGWAACVTMLKFCECSHLCLGGLMGGVMETNNARRLYDV